MVKKGETTKTRKRTTHDRPAHLAAVRYMHHARNKPIHLHLDEAHFRAIRRDLQTYATKPLSLYRAAREWVRRGATPVIVRYEPWGAWVKLETMPALVAIDRDGARALGLDGGKRWDPDRAIRDGASNSDPIEVHLAVTSRCAV